MASSDFNWNGEDEKKDTVFPSIQAVAVYGGLNGNVIIRQQGEAGEDDSYVVIPRIFVDAVISAIKQAATDDL